MDLKIITLQDEAFYSLVKEIVAEVKAMHGKPLDKWIDGKEAMQLLRIKSPTTLQKMRDTGAIRYSQPEKKIILYDRDSIMAFIEKHARDPF